MNKDLYLKVMGLQQRLNKTASVYPGSIGLYRRAYLQKQAGLADNWNTAVQSWKSSGGENIIARMLTFLGKIFGAKGKFSFGNSATSVPNNAAQKAATPAVTNNVTPTAQQGATPAVTPAATKNATPAATPADVARANKLKAYRELTGKLFQMQQEQARRNTPVSERILARIGQADKAVSDTARTGIQKTKDAYNRGIQSVGDKLVDTGLFVDKDELKRKEDMMKIMLERQKLRKSLRG